MSKLRKGGFTLIELLVVIAIIGILASVVLASLNTARIKARDTRRISDLRQLGNALQLYFDEKRAYPDTLSDLQPTYMSVVPEDPLSVAGNKKYYYNSFANSVTAGTDNAQAVCATDTCGAWYHLAANLESDNAALQSDMDIDDAGTGATIKPTVNDDTKDCAGGTAGKCYDVAP